jgi:uncharacterized protein (TIGR02270 family)
MATSIREFNVELYREHLEVASFLYDQRLAYLNDPEVNWRDIGDWEERFEAHIDALMVGGERALEVCRQQAAVGDAGELHAALRVLCRQRRKDGAFAVLDALDATDETKTRAAAQALCYEAPTGWRDDLLLAFQREALTGLLARVIGSRRFAAEELLEARLAAKAPLGRADLAWALGRVGSPASVPQLSALLDSDEENVCEAAAIALMRLGDDRPLQKAMPAAQTHAWARRVLGIGGSQKSVRVLLAALQGESADDEAVLALGLLGDLSAVAPLLDLLDNDELAGAAAVALNAITGAELYARVFVPDVIDPDELHAEEREAYDKDGTLPTRLGQPYGNWERRALLDKADWRSWLDQHKHRFSREHRWRMGQPYGPSALLQCLESPRTPFAIRRATCEELAIRYRLDVPFEADLAVAHQTRLLPRIEEWIARRSGTFADGRWYFAGELQG